MLSKILIALLGLGLTNWLYPKMENSLKIIISPALSIIAFTSILIFVAFIFGVNTLSISFSAMIFFIFSLSSYKKLKFSINLKPLNIVLLLTATTFICITSFVWLTQALAISPDGYKTGGGGLYGDSALHAAYISRLATGEFPPQNPLFAGQTLVYPFANDLFSAVLIKLGLNLNLAFSIPQIILFVGFISLFIAITKKFTSYLGVTFSLFIMLLGWGIGAYYFLVEWRSTNFGLLQFLNKDYTNNDLYNLHFHNILTGLILPERSFLPGLFLGLLIFLNFINYSKIKDLRLLIINGFILGILPFWHTHTFIFFIITSIIFFAYFIYKSPKVITHFLTLLAITALTSFPFFLLLLSNHPLENFLHFSTGWLSQKENIIIFWMKNSFLIIPLAIIGLFKIDKLHRIYFIPAILIFILANIIIFQPWDWDNIKILIWSFLFFSILAGKLLSELFLNGKLVKLLISLIILTSTLSGLLSLAFQLKYRFTIYDLADIELSSWLKKNTNVDDIFLIDPIPNHPSTGLAGRLAYVGYPGHLWVHGIDYSKREKINNQIYAGDFSKINNIDPQITYIILPNNKLLSENKDYLIRTFENQKYTVYKNALVIN